MSENTSSDGRILTAPATGSVTDPAEAHGPAPAEAPAGVGPGDSAQRSRPQRQSGPFGEPKHRRRYLWLVGGLLVLAALATYGNLAWDNPMPPGSEGFWIIAKLRVESIVVMLVVAVCQAVATVSFQTATNNRIITPSIMGFESLYTVVQTAAVFFFGVAGVTMVVGLPQFFLQAGLMVVFAVLLYSWLLSGRFGNMHIMLLVGVVLGGGLGALSTFMQRVLDPNEFDVLTARLFGNISNAQTEYLPYAIPIVVVCAAVLFIRARRLNVMSLGQDATNNLGLNHKRETMIVLTLVAILMAMTTSLVGPMTFLGFLVATLAYQFTDTYDHRLILPVAVLIGYTILSVAYFVLRNIFYAEGAVTIIIELVGGLVFLIVIMRKGRL
ncbi:iron chelate uptake ABC transporter family permease subunit [Citricoccus sp. K5]|uniref:iron chelate uptake ABC transporter family permease subunit n=1 Tax=Citricoccus sp. K5 TaxID=2653135 RepID=UPI0012F24472|nr:iron chelate uptake ABC transporter family permease subunit [Citricoccus sp. K5]VXB62414.1 Petrobactin import system permease protein FatC [Citricoccus sp. K5]